MSYRPPDSTGSTSSSLYHPLSHSPSGSWAETVEEQALAEDAPLAWTSSEESEDDTAFEGESLTDEDPRDIAVKAWEKLGLLLHQTQQDKPDIWASPAFNRPLIGTENDREVAKRMAPFFKDLTQYLDDTDWMYPTPRTFRPYQPHATTTSSSTREAPLDLPVFQSPHESHNQMQEAADLANRMRHLRVFPVTGPTEDPHQGSSDAARMDTPARERQKAFSAFVESLGEAEAELEMSFANDSIAGGARNAHLIREVSMLGV